MSLVKLEPNQKEINGGEYHSISFDLDSESKSLLLEIEGMCYGTHAFDFNMLMSAIGPDELEQFGRDLINLAAEMRVFDEEN